MPTSKGQAKATSQWLILILLALLGFGMGATFVSVTIAATDGVPPHEAGLASGILNTSQQVGGSIGLAVLTGVATSATKRFIGSLHLKPPPCGNFCAQLSKAP